jgi:hypothetical protein
MTNTANAVSNILARRFVFINSAFFISVVLPAIANSASEVVIFASFRIDVVVFAFAVLNQLHVDFQPLFDNSDSDLWRAYPSPEACARHVFNQSCVSD